MTVPDVSTEAQKDAVLNMDREATVILHKDNENTYYIAVKSEWFKQYISPHCGTVHDCYIARVSENWSEIIPLSPIQSAASGVTTDPAVPSLPQTTSVLDPIVSPIGAHVPHDKPHSPLQNNGNDGQEGLYEDFDDDVSE